MYGKYDDQSCYFNPQIKYISPADESIIEHGTIIELIADFYMLNQEA